MQKNAKKPKIPKKITPQYLENAALYYLERYATSAANFRTVMQRKINKSCRHHGTDPDSFAPLLDDLVQRYIKAGLLDDTTYARAKTSSFRRRGLSARMIHMKLGMKGIDPTLISDSLTKVDTEESHAENAELEAALTHARRKKIGPYRKVQTDDPKAIQKEMASLARAGFSYDICRTVMDTDIHDDKTNTIDMMD